MMSFCECYLSIAPPSTSHISYSISCNGSANRHPVDEDSEIVAGLMQSKSTSSKWNREEGDVDVGSAKSRADFVGKMKEKRHSPSTSGLIGMRSVVSAPDFSELKMLHESTDKTVIGRKRGFQSVREWLC